MSTTIKVILTIGAAPITLIATGAFLHSAYRFITEPADRIDDNDCTGVIIIPLVAAVCGAALAALWGF